jgi:hypothetical protein
LPPGTEPDVPVDEGPEFPVTVPVLPMTEDDDEAGEDPVPVLPAITPLFPVVGPMPGVFVVDR